MSSKKIGIIIAAVAVTIMSSVILTVCLVEGKKPSETSTKDSVLVEGDVTAACDAERGTVSGGGNFSIGDTVTLTATAKEGYVFLGWYNANGEKISEQSEYTFVVTAENDGTYYASFSTPLPVYTVTLDLNGGDELAETVLQVEEGYDKPLPKPTRDGYYFCGWKKSRLNVSVKTTDRFRDAYADVTEDTTFYATWMPERCATFSNNAVTISAVYTKEELVRYLPKSSCVLLEADIDLSGTTWTPIEFFGVFEGNNHTISNVYIDYSNCFTDNPDSTDTIFCGFFSEFRGFADNVNLSGVTLKMPTREKGVSYPYMYCGGFAGTVQCWYNVLVGVDDGNGNSTVKAYTELNNCFVGDFMIDGVAGNWNGVFAGKVGGDTKYNVLFNGCHTSSDMQFCSTYYGVYPCFGGLIGNLDYKGTVKNCYSDVNVIAQYTDEYSSAYSADYTFTGSVGGLIGAAYGSTVINSYATGTLSLKANRPIVGGIVGSLGAYSPQSWVNFGSTVKNCYYKGRIEYYPISSETNERAAFVGGIGGSMSYGHIINCWTDVDFYEKILQAFPDNVTTYSGGIVGGTGDFSYGDATVKNCFTVNTLWIGNGNNIKTSENPNAQYTAENVGTYGGFEKEKLFGEYCFGEYLSAGDVTANPENVWIIDSGVMKLYWQ